MIPSDLDCFVMYLFVVQDTLDIPVLNPNSTNPLLIVFVACLSNLKRLHTLELTLEMVWSTVVAVPARVPSLRKFLFNSCGVQRDFDALKQQYPHIDFGEWYVSILLW